MEMIDFGLCFSRLFKHIRTAHIEGGEVSGNIDDTIRHAVTKLCHFHFVGNKTAKLRVIMGEKVSSVFQIDNRCGIMLSKNLKPIKFVKKHYEISLKIMQYYYGIQLLQK